MLAILMWIDNIILHDILARGNQRISLQEPKSKKCSWKCLWWFGLGYLFKRWDQACCRWIVRTIAMATQTLKKVFQDPDQHNNDRNKIDALKFLHACAFTASMIKSSI